MQTISPTHHQQIRQIIHLIYRQSIMEVNDKIRRMRELNSWSQEEMAERLGMSTNGYAKLERGETSLNIPKLEKIAAIFNINLSDLLAINERSIVCLINENSQNSSNYYGNHPNALQAQIEKLQLIIDHQQQTLILKEQLIAQQNREIDSLRDALAQLKNNHL